MLPVVVGAGTKGIYEPPHPPPPPEDAVTEDADEAISVGAKKLR